MKENFINLQKEVYDFLILRGIKKTEDAQKVSLFVKTEDEKKLLEERFQTFTNSGCTPDDSLVYAVKEVKNFKMQKKEQQKTQKQQEREQKQREKEQKKLDELSQASIAIEAWGNFGISCDEKGRVRNVINNYVRYLSNPELIKHELRFNEITNKKEMDGQPYTDAERTDLLGELEEVGLDSSKKFDDAIPKVFKMHTYNPLQEKFDSLTWDGTKRAESIFIDYLGVENTPLNRKMTFIWLYAAVKRAIEPSCKFDQVLIIQGPQGAGKTVMFDRLSFGYKTNNPDISTRDGKRRMHRAWFVIWDELVSLGKKGTEEAKTFISEDIDDYRSPYDREEVDHKRHFVFCGTTNEENFLKDYTGKVERRFWVMKATRCSENNIVFRNFNNAVVEQVWAEVYAQYKADKEAGFERPLVLLDNDFKEFAKKQQDFKAQRVDDRFAYILDALELKYPRKFIKQSGKFYLLDNKYFCKVAVDHLPDSILKEDYTNLNNALKDSKNSEKNYDFRKDPFGQLDVFPMHLIGEMLSSYKFNRKDIRGVCRAFADWYKEDWEFKRVGEDRVYSLVRKKPLVLTEPNLLEDENSSEMSEAEIQQSGGFENLNRNGHGR